MNERSKMLLGDFGILLCALCWGSSYSVSKLVLSEMTIFWSLTFRFTIASAVILALFYKNMLRLPKEGVKAGVYAGLALAANYTIALVALKMTTAGNQAFINTTFVIMVPFIYWWVRREFPGVKVFAAAAISFLGLALLTVRPGFTVNPGDVLCLGSAFALSIHMIILDKYTRLFDPIGLTVVQMLTILPVVFFMSLLFEPVPERITPLVAKGSLYLAVVTSVLPYLLQNVAQKYTTANHTAIIMTLEGVFGVLFGIMLLGETVSRNMFFACALILAGVVLVETNIGGTANKETL